MKPIQTGSIAAPGFLGLNTQDSSVQLSSGFALTANNCVSISMVELVQGVDGLL